MITAVMALVGVVISVITLVVGVVTAVIAFVVGELIAPVCTFSVVRAVSFPHLSTSNE